MEKTLAARKNPSLGNIHDSKQIIFYISNSILCLWIDSNIYGVLGTSSSLWRAISLAIGGGETNKLEIKL